MAIASLAFIYLLGLLFLKYDQNNFSIVNFRIDYAGNILSIMIAVFTIIACSLVMKNKRKLDSRKINVLVALQIISILALIFVLFVQKINVINSNGYIFSFPAKKVYVGFLFVLSSISQIYCMIYLLGIIIGSENYYEVRTLLRTLFTILILMVFSLLFVWNVKEFDQAKLANSKFEYGFVPGAAVYNKGKPSPIFEARIKKAYILFSQGIINKIILTGGKAPGEISEAESAYNYLKNLGVPVKDMIAENHSSTTTEQIKYLKNSILSGNQNEKVLLISDGFHLTRVIEIAKFFKIKAIGVSSDYSMSFSKTIFYRTRESVALLLFWFFAI